MIITYEKMTGRELENIYFECKKSLKLTQADFAKRLGIGRTKLHEQFKVQKVDEEISKAVIADPELASMRTLIRVPDTGSEQLSDEKSKFFPENGVLVKTLEMLNDTLLVLKSNNEDLKAANNTLTENNSHIRGEATFLRKIVEKGFNEGLIAWNPKALKKA